MRVGTGHAHGKIILIGEHSVVHGQPAIAIPLRHLPVTVTLQETTNAQQFVSDVFTGTMAELPGLFDGIRVLVDRLLRRFNEPECPFTLTVVSKIPEERGMGSSAAVATAIVRAFYDFFDTQLDQQTLLATVNIEEMITHGTPSGIDAATVSADQPVWFVKGAPLTHFAMHTHAWLVVGDTGVTGQTGMAVNSVKELLTDPDQPGVGEHLINHLGALTKAAADALQHDQRKQLGLILNQAQSDLATLGVNHPVLQRLIDAANQTGALGAKLTGGGLGGCMFAVANDEQTAKQIATSLKQHGAVATWLEPLTAL
ncbi:mevalonate kinase [Furfurilactobacillus siliginis]|uniref:Mevalonate kinase n=1 Tax=Furfurilactobacillus siliginis TaxID=348151 RepID=A0A0R2LFZ3_9LACO|nr:mevalonate kinase [Furfurilactobacillus siliginis]KRN96948.1 mevalonate kinase [Furfurilactobacillus siliginis]GEK27707.1 mevalonate kinase [Furfurilactobacillus siliginis]